MNRRVLKIKTVPNKNKSWMCGDMPMRAYPNGKSVTLTFMHNLEVIVDNGKSQQLAVLKAMGCADINELIRVHLIQAAQ